MMKKMMVMILLLVGRTFPSIINNRECLECYCPTLVDFSNGAVPNSDKLNKEMSFLCLENKLERLSSSLTGLHQFLERIPASSNVMEPFVECLGKEISQLDKEIQERQENKQRMLAFCMAQYPRIGAESPASVLPELVRRRIYDYLTNS